MIAMIMALDPYDVLGVAGFLLYATAYLLVSLRFLTSEDIAFFALNGLGAVCVLISLSMSFNLGSLLIQVFYISTSATAIVARLRRPVRARLVDRAAAATATAPSSF